MEISKSPKGQSEFLLKKHPVPEKEPERVWLWWGGRDSHPQNEPGS